MYANISLKNVWTNCAFVLEEFKGDVGVARLEARYDVE